MKYTSSSSTRDWSCMVIRSKMYCMVTNELRRPRHGSVPGRPASSEDEMCARAGPGTQIESPKEEKHCMNCCCGCDFRLRLIPRNRNRPKRATLNASDTLLETLQATARVSLFGDRRRLESASKRRTTRGGERHSPCAAGRRCQAPSHAHARGAGSVVQAASGLLGRSIRTDGRRGFQRTLHPSIIAYATHTPDPT